MWWWSFHSGKLRSLYKGNFETWMHIKEKQWTDIQTWGTVVIQKSRGEAWVDSYTDSVDILMLGLHPADMKENKSRLTKPVSLRYGYLNKPTHQSWERAILAGIHRQGLWRHQSLDKGAMVLHPPIHSRLLSTVSQHAAALSSPTYTGLPSAFS